MTIAGIVVDEATSGLDFLQRACREKEAGLNFPGKSENVPMIESILSTHKAGLLARDGIGASVFGFFGLLCSACCIAFKITKHVQSTFFNYTTCSEMVTILS
eukprot:4019094-Amphidinium_carterae.1